MRTSTIIIVTYNVMIVINKKWPENDINFIPAIIIIIHSYDRVN